MRATSIEKKAVCAPRALNEAYDYEKPSSFSRAMRLEFGNVAVLLISGTASIGANGESLHVVRTTCYLRDIERDYAAFNEERTAFYREQDLDPLPASTGIQAILCRPELLVEIEGIAIFRTAAPTEE